MPLVALIGAKIYGLSLCDLMVRVVLQLPVKQMHKCTQMYK